VHALLAEALFHADHADRGVDDSTSHQHQIGTAAGAH
jgi:hypothetical protein